MEAHISLDQLKSGRAQIQERNRPDLEAEITELETFLKEDEAKEREFEYISGTREKRNTIAKIIELAGLTYDLN